ncbi:MAG: TlpA family protein disulfide reductase [Myxococcota bacterium]
MITRISALALGALLTLGACADPELATKVTELEAKLDGLEKQVASGGGAAAPAGASLEDGARDAFKAIQGKVAELDFDSAKTLCKGAMSKFGRTKAAQRQGRICDEVAVVGKDAMDLDVDKWFQGEAKLADSGATLLVFWEQWCPHCKREVPEIEATYNKYKGRMNVVGLTKVNRSATDEKVEAFIKEKAVTYPMGKEKDGSLSQYYNVSGVPAAALVKDGKIVWRGHPARLKGDALDKLL